jgi:hypothetical protein
MCAMSGAWLTWKEIGERIDWSQVKPARVKRFRWLNTGLWHPVGQVIVSRLIPRGGAERHNTEPRYRLTAEGMGVVARLLAGERFEARTLMRRTRPAAGGLPGDRLALSALVLDAWRSIADMCRAVGVQPGRVRASPLYRQFRFTLNKRLVPWGYAERAISDDYACGSRPRDYFRLTELGAFLSAELEELIG